MLPGVWKLQSFLAVEDIYAVTFRIRDVGPNPSFGMILIESVYCDQEKVIWQPVLL